MLGPLYVTLPGLLAALLASTVSATASTAVDYTTIKASNGDHFPDFSYCGYRASDASLPSAKSTISLKAGSGDQTATIQKALDKAAAAGGGVVTLAAGTYELTSGLKISSKTVLRGAGMGKTVLKSSNGDVDTIVMGTGAGSPTLGKAVAITDKYVAVGADTFTVASTTGLKVGGEVYVQRQVTQEWIHANYMDILVRDGKKETWIKAGTEVRQPRKIKKISGTTITIDIPLTDALNSKYMTPQLLPYTSPAVTSEMGIEEMSITLTPTCSGAIINNGAHCSGNGLNMTSWSVNSFARNLNMTGFNSFIYVGGNAFQHTISGVHMYRDGKTDDSKGYASDITLTGTQILIVDSASYGASSARAFSIITGGLTPGPNAVVRFTAGQSVMEVYPHQRWAHGLLVDDSSTTLNLINRGILGSGHGWTVTSGVGWNIKGSLWVESPPLGLNWCVGCVGTKKDGSNGTFIDYGKTVTPTSLFAAQLAARQK